LSASAQWNSAARTIAAKAIRPPHAISAYVDEVIYFTDRASYVNSFMTKFDDVVDINHWLPQLRERDVDSAQVRRLSN
jgi:hypothetical protein